MYKRTETIEEEHLDWSNSSVQLNEEINTERKGTVVPIPVSTQGKIVPKKRFRWFRINFLKRKFTMFISDNFKLFLIISLLAAPYFVGFFLSYLVFYYYGNVPLSNFFSLLYTPLSLQVWAIGAYLFVLLWEVWILLSRK